MAKEKVVFETDIRDAANKLQSLLNEHHTTREISIAKTKLDECVMWALKGANGQ